MERHPIRRSPNFYLFDLCISIATDQGIWRPIRLSRNGPPITHLAFVDDVILSVKASLDQVRLVKNILNLFCRSTGQKISLDKSRMLFSNNVGRQMKQHLNEEIKIPWSENLGKYLGVQIFHNRPSRNTF